MEADVISVTLCLIQPQFRLPIASKSTAARNGTEAQTQTQTRTVLLPSFFLSVSLFISFLLLFLFSSSDSAAAAAAFVCPAGVYSGGEKRQIGGR